MQLIIKTLIIALSAIVISACSTSTQYGDAQAVETVNTDFGSTDLQTIAAKMVDDLLMFPPMIAITSSKRPVMFVDRVKNKTTEHIDMQSITDTIQSKLLNSGKYRFIDMDVVNEVANQMDYQTKSGMVNEEHSAKMGKQIGAEYMLYGNMSSIVKRDGNTTDVYYKFTLKLLHLESGILEWSAEKEIRKTKDKRWFGS
ncbi:MAG: penicillin-binding protein activator LpoB [Pseudomonadales bacterium]|nr:penicillin-binding protein activator LpoB [Pseudomonadales bacterium]